MIKEEPLPYWIQAANAIESCRAGAEGLAVLAERLDGVPNGAILQGSILQAAATMQVAAALNRIAFALERNRDPSA